MIKTETFKYTGKDGDPYTKLVYFSDFKAELQAYLTYDSGGKFRYLVMKCVDWLILNKKQYKYILLNKKWKSGAGG